MSRRWLLVFLLQFGFAPGLAVAAGVSLPSGWQIQSPEGSGNTAVADFNGDGNPDTAVIATNFQSGKSGLLLRLSDARGGYSWKFLRVQPEPTKYRSHVKTGAPGEFKVMCVYRDGACDRVKTPLRSTTAPLFYCENDQGPYCAMQMVFVWDAIDKKFIQGLYGY